MGELGQAVLDAYSDHILAFLLGAVRLSAIMGFAPFFGAQVIGPLRFTLIAVMYMPLHPMIHAQLVAIGGTAALGIMDIVLLAAKEAAIGGIIGLLAGMAFWAATAAGTITDNQRGASQAQGSDILTGGETTPFGSVLFLSMVTLFYTTGGIMAFLAIVYEGYALWPVTEYLPALASANLGLIMGENVNHLMEMALLLCAPFMLVALMTDVSLGIINRFTPQLNVYVLSMPIKSGLCAMLIVFYLSPYLQVARDFAQGSLDTIRQVLTIFAP